MSIFDYSLRQNLLGRSLALLLPLAGLFSLTSAQAADSSAATAAINPNPDVLRKTYAASWKTQVHPDLAAFDAWTKALALSQQIPAGAKKAAGPSDKLIAQGVRLAQERRAAMLKLMRTEPARALAGAIPAAVRAKLPAAVLNELETPFSALGDFKVMGSISSRRGPVVAPVQRYIRLANGQRYQAHVYGRRLTLTTKHNVFLHGIIVGNEAVLDENVLALVSDEDAALDGRAPAALSVGGKSIGGSAPVIVRAGGNLYRLPSTGDVRLLEARLRTIEAKRAAESVDAAEHQALLAGGVASSGPVAATAQSTGAKKILVIRVDFADQPGTPVFFTDITDTQAYVQGISDNSVKPYYAKSSYGLTSLTTTVSSKIYRLPRTANSYAVNGDDDGLHTDAENAAGTDFDVASYDRVVVVFTFLGNLANSQIDYGGLAEIGGRNVWINGEYDFRVVAHELGHTYGLLHANLWQVDDGNPASLAGSTTEYGDDFDTMGANFDNTEETDFNVWYKQQLDWIPDSQVQTVTQSGTYRVNRFDNGLATGIVALKIVKDSTRNYYVSVRRNFTSNASMLHGVYVSWGYNSTGIQHNILDMQTPGTDETGVNLVDNALPTGSTFIDSAAGITIAPSAEGGTDPNQYEDVQITIGKVVSAPVINSAKTATATANVAFTYQITATNNPTDFNATSLPNGLTVDAATGLISGTPTIPGTYSVGLEATNTGGTGTGVLTLTVLDNPNVPVVTSAPTDHAFIGQNFTYSITATNSPTSFSAAGLPAGLTLDANVGLISGQATTAGTYPVLLTATNGAGTGAGVALTIYVSAAPAPSSNDNFSGATTLPGGSGNTDGNNTLATKETGEPAHAANAGGHSLWFSWTAPTNGAATFDTLGSKFDTLLAVYTGSAVDALVSVVSNDDYSDLSYGSASRVDFQPVPGQTYFIAVDGADGDSGLVSLQYTQAAGANVPMITSANTALAAINVPFRFQVTATNNPTVFTAATLPAGLAIDAATGLISGTPTAAGTFAVPLTATNASGTGMATLIITVTPAPPVIDKSNLMVTGQVGKPFSYQITASNMPTSYSASNLPPGLVLDVAKGAITGTPTLKGVYPVPITATNGGGSDAATLTITILPSVPTITSTLTATGQIGQPFSYQITADSQPTDYGAIGFPPGVSLTVTKDPTTKLVISAILSGTPRAILGFIPGVAKDFKVTLKATNSGGTGTAILDLTINPPDPVIASALAVSTQVNAPFAYQITATNVATIDYAEEKGIIVYDAQGLPDGLTVDPFDGTITGTPTAIGVYPVTVSAKNDATTTSASLTLTVTVAQPIVAAATVNTQLGVPFSYQVSATDHPTSYSVTGLPAGVKLDATTGVLSGTPSIKGTYSLTISATNVGGTGRTVVTMIVNDSTPVISSPLTAQGGIGAAFSYQIVASFTPTSFGATGLPEGLSINAATGLITGFPTTAGTFPVALTAANSGGTGTATLTITVFSVPTVSLVVPGANGGSKRRLSEGKVLKLRVVRSGGDLSQPLTVQYTARGTNIPGVDYKVLSGTVTILANETTAQIKVRTFDDNFVDGNKILSIKIIPTTEGTYQIGTPGRAKIRVIDLQIAE